MSLGMWALVAVVTGVAARNVGRRKIRVVIVLAGLLVGTAIISSSLVVGDTLSYIFVQDVYARLAAIDEVVRDDFGGSLVAFPEAYFDTIVARLSVLEVPGDGIAPVLLKVIPLRN